jgi:NADH-quinone oxidoreductase subunit E
VLSSPFFFSLPIFSYLPSPKSSLKLAFQTDNSSLFLITHAIENRSKILDNGCMNANEKMKSPQKKEGIAGFKLDLWNYEGEKGALIPLLQAAQDTYGFIPESAIDQISEIVGIPAAEIYGVITFYSQFRLKPLGKYLIKVCDGTACHVNGSERIAGIIEDELQISGNDTTEDGLFTLQKVACLGCCSLSPVIMVNDETYGRLTPKKVQHLLKEYKSKDQKPQST